MRKFTVFSVMLTILVVVIASEVFVNDYLPELKIGSTENDIENYDLPSKLNVADVGTASVLGGPTNSTAPANDGASVPFTDTETPVFTDAAADTTGAVVYNQVVDPAAGGFDQNALEGFVNENQDLVLPTTPDTVSPTSNDVSFDIEDFSNSYDHAKTNVYLTNDHIINAGFTGAYLEPESFDGFLFKTISIGDLYGLKVDKYSITDGKTDYAKIYVIIPEDISTTNEIFSVLKVRAAEGLETDINETNTFGDSNFFMNDMRRQHIAFLTVRIGSFIYGFSYQKDYHPQIKNLVELLK